MADLASHRDVEPALGAVRSLLVRDALYHRPGAGVLAHAGGEDSFCQPPDLVPEVASRNSDWCGADWSCALIPAPVVPWRALPDHQGQAGSTLVQPLPDHLVLPLRNTGGSGGHGDGTLSMRALAECAAGRQHPERSKPRDRAVARAVCDLPGRGPLHSWCRALHVSLARGIALVLAGDRVVHRRTSRSPEHGQGAQQPAVPVLDLLPGSDGIHG